MGGCSGRSAPTPHTDPHSDTARRELAKPSSSDVSWPILGWMRYTALTTIADAILGLGTAALSVTAGAVLAVALGLVPLAS